MQHFKRVVAVGTTPTVILHLNVSQLHNFVIYPKASIEIGNDDLSIGNGEPLAAGAPAGYNWRDFNPDDPQQELKIYAVAESPTTVIVHGWRF